MNVETLVKLLDEARRLIDTETPYSISRAAIESVDAILASISAQKTDWKTEVDLARSRVRLLDGNPNSRIDNWQSAYDAINGLRMRAANLRGT